MNLRLTRRRLIGSGAGVFVAAPLAALAPGCGEDGDGDTTTVTGAQTATPEPPRDGDEALERLLEGNERFVQGRFLNEQRGDVQRAMIAEGQEPFAIVLGCADSRVPPEVIFDQALGACSSSASPGTPLRTRWCSAASNTRPSTSAASC